MNNVDKQYLDLLHDILENGVYKNTRSGGVISVFDRNIKINMKDGFPMLTTKKIFIRGSIHEMLWMLNGDTNIRYLLQNNVHIWDDDAYRWYQQRVIKNNEVAKLISIGEKNVLPKSDFLEKVLNYEHLILFNSDGKEESYTFGDLGPVYGRQWRGFGAKNIDQIEKIIELLKTNPDDRRLLCMAWNPNDLDDMALPPCHYGFQLYSRPLSNSERLDWLCEHSNGEYDEWKLASSDKLDELNVPKRELSLKWSQRSCDFFLGIPLNITGYGLILSMIAQCVNMTVGTLSGSFGDCHIYEAHIDAVKEQLSRNPYKYNLPKLMLNKDITNIFDFKIDDIKIEGYESYPKITAPLCVG